MTLAEEIEALTQKFAALATEPDDALTTRYHLAGSALPSTPYWLLRRLASAIRRFLGRARLGPTAAWPARLRQAAGSPSAKPFVIWAVGADRETLRTACRGFKKLEPSLPDFAPVLVTDVAEFAFFSRLGWLVEFLPELEGHDPAYEERKAKLLARTYRGAPVLPIRAGISAEAQAEDLRRWIRETPGAQPP